MNFFKKHYKKLKENPFLFNLVYYILLIVSAILWGLGQWPNYLSAVRFFGLVPFFYILFYRKRYILDSLIFGTVAYLMNFYFLYMTFTVSGKMNIIISALIVLALCAYYGLQYPLTAFITKRFYKFNKKFIILFPLIFVTVDFLYFKIFRHTIGDGMIGLYYFIQMIEFTGMTGVALIIMYSNLSLFYILKNRFLNREIKVYHYVVFFIIAAVFVYGFFRVAQLKSIQDKLPLINGAMIQGNISGKDKMQDGMHDTNVERYNSLSKKAVEMYTLDFVLWPESVFSNSSYDGSLEALRKLVFREYSTLILGITRWIRDEHGMNLKIYNSAILVENLEEIQKYDKRRLLVFGEFIPFEKYLPFLNYLTPLSFSMQSGNKNIIFDVGEYSNLAVSICFEGIFPDDIRKKVNEGANVMINMTNDSWYGDTIGPVHHSAIARLRGIENRRSLFRCTATGLTTASDLTGRVVEKGEVWEPTIVYAGLPLYRGRTLYSYIGELLSYISISIIFLLIAAYFVNKIIVYIRSVRLHTELNLEKNLGVQKRLGVMKNLGVEKGLGIKKILK